MEAEIYKKEEKCTGCSVDQFSEFWCNECAKKFSRVKKNLSLIGRLEKLLVSSGTKKVITGKNGKGLIILLKNVILILSRISSDEITPELTPEAKAIFTELIKAFGIHRFLVRASTFNAGKSNFVMHLSKFLNLSIISIDAIKILCFVSDGEDQSYYLRQLNTIDTLEQLNRLIIESLISQKEHNFRPGQEFDESSEWTPIEKRLNKKVDSSKAIQATFAFINRLQNDETIHVIDGLMPALSVTKVGYLNRQMDVLFHIMKDGYTRAVFVTCSLEEAYKRHVNLHKTASLKKEKEKEKETEELTPEETKSLVLYTEAQVKQWSLPNCMFSGEFYGTMSKVTVESFEKEEDKTSFKNMLSVSHMETPISGEQSVDNMFIDFLMSFIPKSSDSAKFETLTLCSEPLNVKMIVDGELITIKPGDKVIKLLNLDLGFFAPQDFSFDNGGNLIVLTEDCKEILLCTNYTNGKSLSERDMILIMKLSPVMEQKEWYKWVLGVTSYPRPYNGSMVEQPSRILASQSNDDPVSFDILTSDYLRRILQDIYIGINPTTDPSCEFNCPFIELYDNDLFSKDRLAKIKASQGRNKGLTGINKKGAFLNFAIMKADIPSFLSFFKSQDDKKMAELFLKKISTCSPSDLDSFLKAMPSFNVNGLVFEFSELFPTEYDIHFANVYENHLIMNIPEEYAYNMQLLIIKLMIDASIRIAVDDLNNTNNFVLFYSQLSANCRLFSETEIDQAMKAKPHTNEYLSSQGGAHHDCVINPGKNIGDRLPTHKNGMELNTSLDSAVFVWYNDKNGKLRVFKLDGVAFPTVVLQLLNDIISGKDINYVYPAAQALKKSDSTFSINNVSSSTIFGPVTHFATHDDLSLIIEWILKNHPDIESIIKLERRTFRIISGLYTLDQYGFNVGGFYQRSCGGLPISKASEMLYLVKSDCYDNCGGNELSSGKRFVFDPEKLSYYVCDLSIVGNMQFVIDKGLGFYKVYRMLFNTYKTTININVLERERTKILLKTLIENPTVVIKEYLDRLLSTPSPSSATPLRISSCNTVALIHRKDEIIVASTPNHSYLKTHEECLNGIIKMLGGRGFAIFLVK